MHAGLLCVHSSTSITPMLLGLKVASAAALAISDFMCVTIVSVNNYIAQHELPSTGAQLRSHSRLYYLISSFV